MQMTEAKRLSLSVLLPLLMLCGACSSTGSISGTVTVTGASDATAIVSIPGASFITGAGGSFSFASVPAGSVTVIATRDGYAPASQTVTVTAGKTASAALTLTVAPSAPVVASLTAVPATVPPGGAVTVFSTATSTDGYPLSYTWTAPAGWTAQGGTANSTLVLKAPATFGQTGQVLLQVDDGHGAMATASTVVVTTADSSPTASVIATPSNPRVGQPVSLTAYASAANGQTVTYAWTLDQLPIGSQATLTGATTSQTGFTPDVSGTYGTVLVVTDAAGLSVQVFTTVTVASANPVATIAGTMPLQATVSQPLLIDGSSSTNPAGNPLAFSWSITSWPAGSACSGTGCLAPVANGSMVKLKTDVAGSYSLLLTVTDVVSGNVGRATAAITAKGGQGLNVLSGSGQQPTVHQTLANPIVVQLVDSGGNPISGAGLTWAATNGAITSSSSSTDANGRASAVVLAGRLAQQGSVTVFVTSNPTLTQTVTFAPQADQPASYVLAVTNLPTVNGSATVTVQVSDQFGNLTTADSVANSASMTLTLSSSSTKAVFGTASVGSLGNLMSPSPGVESVTITLSNGTFSVPVTDTVAESLHLELQQVVTGRVLPFAAWNTAYFDGAEAGISRWNVNNTNAVSSWNTESTTVDNGTEAFGVSYAAAQELTSQETDLVSKTSLSSSNTVTLLTFASYVQVTGAADAMNNCIEQANYRVRLGSSSTGGYYLPVTPAGGYSVLNTCGGGGPSLGSTNGSWTSQQVDLTDGVSSGYDYLDFESAYVTDANVPNETTPASWDVDNIWVQTLSASSSSAASTSVTLSPGAATTLVLSAQDVLLDECISGMQSPVLTLNAVDANGNSAATTTQVTVTWTGATGTVTPEFNGGVSEVALLSNGVSFRMSPGGTELELTDTVTSDSLTLSATASGLSSPAPVSAGPVTYHCHSNGLGEDWSDSVAPGTPTETEALYACESTYGTGNCATAPNDSFVYATTSGTCPAYVWTYSNWSATAGSCGLNGNAAAGQVERYYAFSASPSCSCGGGVAGQTSNIEIQAYTSWE